MQDALIRSLSALAVLTLLLPLPRALAQSTYGTIMGTVVDAQGGVIAGAKVEITNKSTGLARSVVTDDQGAYKVVSLDPGTYIITVGAAGMVQSRRSAVELLAREIVRADFQLQVSAVSQQVEVKANSAIADQSLTISDSKSGNDINALALNFRATNDTSPIVVANLAPGVQPDKAGNISISGGLPNSTSFSIDGISTQLVRFGGPNTDLFPSVETIAEFRVNTASNNPQFSQPTNLTLISKSGGILYHGTGFWFFQRDSLNARDAFAATKPKLQADDFGASLGGPLSIPGIYNAKNKTFFFFTYEGTRRPQEFLLNQLVPPTPWRTGDLSSIKTPIINPATGHPFSNNQIPVNPVSAKILSIFFASPTDPANVSIAAPNFTKNFTGNYSQDGYDGRIDHNFSDRHKVFFRITDKSLLNSGTGGDPNYNTQLGTLSATTSLLNLAGSYNWNIKPNLINEFRAGYTSG